MSSQWAKSLHTFCSHRTVHRSLRLQRQWKHHRKSLSASSVSTDHLFPLAKHTRHLSISQQVCSHCPLQSCFLTDPDTVPRVEELWPKEVKKTCHCDSSSGTECDRRPIQALDNSPDRPSWRDNPVNGVFTLFH